MKLIRGKIYNKNLFFNTLTPGQKKGNQGSSFSSSKALHETVEVTLVLFLYFPSGLLVNKLGVILFTVMTNKLLSDWRLRIKYVDDTSALEIIPRNSPSLLNVVASDIHNFAIAHNMRLHPTKCKEMHINFLRNSNCLINPIIIGGNVIKRANTYKILGVIMDNDLK